MIEKISVSEGKVSVSFAEVGTLLDQRRSLENFVHGGRIDRLQLTDQQRADLLEQVKRKWHELEDTILLEAAKDSVLAGNKEKVKTLLSGYAKLRKKKRRTKKDRDDERGRVEQLRDIIIVFREKNKLKKFDRFIICADIALSLIELILDAIDNEESETPPKEVDSFERSNGPLWDRNELPTDPDPPERGVA